MPGNPSVKIADNVPVFAIILRKLRLLTKMDMEISADDVLAELPDNDFKKNDQK